MSDAAQPQPLFLPQTCSERSSPPLVTIREEATRLGTVLGLTCAVTQRRMKSMCDWLNANARPRPCRKGPVVSAHAGTHAVTHLHSTPKSHRHILPFQGGGRGFVEFPNHRRLGDAWWGTPDRSAKCTECMEYTSKSANVSIKYPQSHVLSCCGTSRRRTLSHPSSGSPWR